jgi:sugar O-acyltransferase (sialic acid O-acetyltransferase NeuD family)
MLIVGAKGFAKEVLEVCYQLEMNEEIYFFDNVSDDLPTHLYDKFKILRNFDEVAELFRKGEKKFTIGIGNPTTRYKMQNKFKELGGEFSSIISPFAHIGHFDNEIGIGSNIMTGTVITNSITLGEGALVNLNCTIGHDTVIGKFVEMSPDTHFSGNSKIGDFCIFGTNSTVLPKVTIGSNVIVGAGSVITKDIPSNSLVVGVPGKIVKELPELIFEK